MAATEVDPMLAVSRAVLGGGPLTAILDRIAGEAVRVAPGADRSSIVLIEGSERRFRLAGSHGLSRRYRRLLATGETKLRPGEGPSGVAYETGGAVVVADLEADPRTADWSGLEIARAEGYRAIVSLPLVLDGTVVGTLNLYRAQPGSWPDEHVRLASFFAEHAASAVRTAQLLDQRGKQVTALRRLVRALREQTHEHANRLHAVSGLLALDEVDDAKQFLHVLESSHTALRETLDARLQVPVVAGLVLADAVVAAQRGIELGVDESSSLERLPPALSDTQVVTILGNLLDNAFDAVADAAPERRAVRLRVAGSDAGLLIEVADRGPGPPPGVRLFERGATSKDGHQGLGLALAQEAVTAAMGTIEVERVGEETVFRVAIPDG